MTKWRSATPSFSRRANIVLDTAALAAVLSQYFSGEDRLQPEFRPDGRLSQQAVAALNLVVKGSGYRVVAASALAFVELARKWDEIVQTRFALHQLAAFIESPPEWFVVDPLDPDLMGVFCTIPRSVTMPNGSVQRLEWADVVHAATAVSRAPSVLVTGDRRLRALADALQSTQAVGWA